MKRLTLVIGMILLTVCPALADPARVAVWDPEFGTVETRFTIDRALLDRAAGWLGAAGMRVTRLGADAIADPERFSSDRFDLLVMDGGTFPKSAAGAILRFLDGRGVLVALNAAIPFLIAIEPEPTEPLWTMSPRQPTFAWQSKQILESLGMQYVYQPRLHDQGFDHTATALLQKYLPEAGDILGRRLPGRWLVSIPTTDPGDGYYPLIRSRRLDGLDVTPQVYVVRRGARTAIVASSGIFSAGDDPALFAAGGEKMVVALARLGADLQSGELSLDPANRLVLASDQTPPAPLESRPATVGVNPNGAIPLARWGRFNGSCIELAPALTGETRLDASQSERFPRALMPGASVTLTLADLGAGARFLRVRGAVIASGGKLMIRYGGALVLGETLLMPDARGEGNFQAPSLGSVPLEFHRVVYLPPLAEGAVNELTVSNPGSSAIWFDAMQIERRDRPNRTMLVGLGGGYVTGTTGSVSPLPREISRRWSTLRTSARLQYLGPPGDPHRWDKVDAILRQQMDVNPRVEVIIEGTPPWAAITPERLEEGKKAGRPHVVPPDNDLYAKAIEDFIDRYGDRIDSYEIWNEPNIVQFWRGSIDEYVAMYLKIVPVIRKKDPTARIIAAGMAGVHEEFIERMIDSGALAMADLIAIHPYAGKGPGWDLVFGQCEGAMFNHGIATEIYSNESGFPYRNAEWFKPPPVYTPQVQADMLSKAMSRLMAGDVAKVNVFHAGGDSHEYGLFDASGSPRPAYSVFADYLTLADGNARRLDVAMVAADGAALEGVFCAASRQDDRSVTVVINPALNAALRPPAPIINPSNEFDSVQGWHCFYGQLRHRDGKVTLIPAADKPYVGFNGVGDIDLRRWPIVELVIADAQGPVRLNLKIAGRDVAVMENLTAGTHRMDLRKLLTLKEPAQAEVTIRAEGEMTLDALRFAPAPAPASAPGPAAGSAPDEKDEKQAFSPVPLLVRLTIPVSAAPSRATMRVSQVETELKFTFAETKGQGWVGITVPLTSRTVIRLVP